MINLTTAATTATIGVNPAETRIRQVNIPARRTARFRSTVRCGPVRGEINGIVVCLVEVGEGENVWRCRYAGNSRAHKHSRGGREYADCHTGDCPVAEMALWHID